MNLENKNTFLSTLGAMMAVAVPIAGVSWFIADSRFVDKDRYNEAQIEQVRTNQELKTETKQLNERLKTLNLVLEKINFTQPNKPLVERRRR